MDKEVRKLIREETQRRDDSINLIASENYASKDVREALGSVFLDKYAEGYPAERYYAGNGVIDALEKLAIQRARKLFSVSSGEWDVNVQPYSGSPANLAVLHALIPRGEKIMAMSLAMGGHLTHGHKASVTGKIWEQVPYGVDRLREEIDYGELLHIALVARPKCIIAGGSAYARKIDFKRMRTIADEAGSILFVDISHFAGLVAGKMYPSPFPYADVVTTTTHKTLRGPRAAMIFSKKNYSSAINKAVFPGIQGGPHMNQVAAIAVALHEAGTPAFRKYASRVIENAKALANELERLGWRIVSNGTDTHLFLVDVAHRGISGGVASRELEKAGIILNKNMIPFDARTPGDPSGIRIGTPAMTTRGMGVREMRYIAGYIHAVLLKKNVAETKKMIKILARKFPIAR